MLGLCSRVPPDLIVLKLEMAGGAGMAVMRMLSPLLDGRWFPILALTDQETGAHIEEAVENGAKDFVTVPYDDTQLLLRIGNLLEMRYSHLELRKQNLLLEAEIEARTQDLHEARIDVLRRLARAVEYRDDDGGQHPQRIGRTAAIIAGELGLAESGPDRLAEGQLTRKAWCWPMLNLGVDGDTHARQTFRFLEVSSYGRLSVPRSARKPARRTIAVRPYRRPGAG